MFHAIASAGTLQDYLDPVDALVEECKIHIGPDGLRTTAVDPANVGMVDAKLYTDAFESYEDDGGTIGVNLDALTDVVGFADDSTLVELELNDATRKLDLQVGVLDYTLALIDPDSIRSEPELPDLALPMRAVALGEQIGTMVDAADMVGDRVALGGNDDPQDRGLYADAQGDTDDATVTFDDIDLIDFDPAEAHSLFSLDYLKDMSGAIPDDAEVTVRLGTEFPVRLDYDTAEGHASVTYQLAPRIQSGDE